METNIHTHNELFDGEAHTKFLLNPKTKIYAQNRMKKNTHGNNK